MQHPTPSMYQGRKSLQQSLPGESATSWNRLVLVLRRKRLFRFDSQFLNAQLWICVSVTNARAFMQETCLFVMLFQSWKFSFKPMSEPMPLVYTSCRVESYSRHNLHLWVFASQEELMHYRESKSLPVLCEVVEL